MRTLIKNCHIISPEEELNNVSLLIEDEIIKQIGSEIEENADMIYDAKGKIVCPGFIDIHTHGAGGYDVTDGKVEGIETIAKCKLKEGVTTFFPTTLTLPEVKLAESLKSVEEYKKRTKFAKIGGIHLEGPFINPECVGAQNPDYVRKPDMEEILRLNKISEVKIISYAPEQEGGIEFTKELAKNNIIPSCGHSAAKYKDIQMAKSAGAKHLTHFCNQMTKLHHREIGMVGAGLLDKDLFIEMICDKIHLCPEMIALIFHSKPIDNIILITDSICASWLPDAEYSLGGLNITVKDGVARLTSNGALAGSTLKYNIALKNVAEITNQPLTQLIKTTSLNQSLSLNLPNLGKIACNYIADIVILNEDFSVEETFVNGKPMNIKSL